MKIKRFSRLFFAILFVAALILSSCTGSAAQTSQNSVSSVEIQLSETPSAAKPEKEKEETSFVVYYLDVGQGDSTVVGCDGEYMLIDGGKAESSSLLYSFLKKRDITHLEYVIGTHGHEDHIGGLPGALNFASAGKVYCSEDTGDTRAFDNFVKAVKKQGLFIVQPEAGDSFELGSAVVEILAPIKFNVSDPNQLSIVLNITYGKTSFLFTGDAGREEEGDILDTGYDLKSTVLKVGHHGSNSSTTYPFLREVMPKYAVISVGKNNDYGHPTENVLSRLKDADVTVYRTDLDGDVICRSDGTSVTFETQKKRPAAGAEDPYLSSDTGESSSSSSVGFLANSNSMKFHKIGCGTGQRTKEENRVFFGTREEALSQGYVPAKCCNP